MEILGEILKQLLERGGVPGLGQAFCSTGNGVCQTRCATFRLGEDTEDDDRITA